MPVDVPEDPLEALLAGIVVLPDDEQAAALDALCTAQPVLAGELRARHDCFRRLQHTSAAPASAGQRFGEFELLRELGRGGMGQVYLARQQRAGEERLVALKLVRDRGLFSARAHERFRREAAAAFRLDDPGICPVFDAGEVDGVPWLAMRYVPGRTLAEHIAEARRAGTLALPAATETGSDAGTAADTGSGTDSGSRFAAVLALGESLARSLHTAHEAGFVHRDVKPSNVMVRPDGQPVLLDFGLVRGDREDHSLTATGETLGTPAYMPPEQIDGSAAVGRTADVYSLAATLFEAIALAPPFSGRTREQLFRAILEHDLPDLRRLVPGVPRDLQTVLSTALAREPDRRYATALEFALDLGRVRRRQPILAQPPGPLRRLALWSARNRLAAGLLAALAVALVAVVFVAIEARSQQGRATDSLESARRAVAELIRVQQEELDGVPWLEQTRRSLQTRALCFLREFMARNHGNAELALANAEATVLAGQLELSLGNPATARQLHGDARAILDIAPPAGCRAVRGRWQMLAGDLLDRDGDAAAAATAFAGAAAELEAGARGDEDLMAAMQALQQASAMHERCNDRSAAVAAVDRAVALRARLADAAANRAVLAAAGALQQRARLRLEASALADADADCDAACRMLRDVRRDSPHDRRATTLLAQTLLQHAGALRLLGRLDQQHAALAEAKGLFDILAQAFPSMPFYREQLALSCQRLAMFKLSGGDEAARQQNLERARELFTVLVEQSPGLPENRVRLASVHYDIGMCRCHEQAVATQSYTAAIEQCDVVLARSPEHAECRRLAAVASMGLANVRAFHGDERAADSYALAERHAEELVRLRPADRRTLDLRSHVLYNHGVYRSERGDLAGALPMLEKAVGQMQDLAAAAPLDAKAAVMLLLAGVYLGEVVDLVQPDRAAATWDRLGRSWAAVPEPLHRTVPDDDMVSAGECSLQRALAAPRARAGDPAAAGELAAVQRRLAAIVGRNPASTEYRFELVVCLADLAAHAEKAGAAADAARWRAAIAANLEQWSDGGSFSRVERMRLAGLRSEIEPWIRANVRASERLQRLLSE